jgi:hypothetical protein
VCQRFVFLLVTRVLAAARLKFSWADWVLIALLLGLIPRARHARIGLIVTQGTILRWRRDPLRCRWARKSRPKGRPSTRRSIRALVLQVARENDGWRYRRIAGEYAGDDSGHAASLR